MESPVSEAGYVSVWLDQNLEKPLDYAVPESLLGKLSPGMRVLVPLGKKTAKGTIEKLKPSSSIPRVRPLVSLLEDHGSIPPALWKLSQWMSDYYATPLDKVLRLFVPASIRKGVQARKNLVCSLSLSQDKSASLAQELRTQAPMQAEVLDLLLSLKNGLSLTELLKNCSRSTLDALVKKKAINISEALEEEDLLLDAPFFTSPPKSLLPEQKQALNAILCSLEEKKFSTHLLLGVTGSGKTEVYLQAIQATLAQGKSALLLVPEIALTSQTIERLRSRFSEKLAILHHKRSFGERSLAWEKLQKGELRLAVGARSAIFAPIQNLGLIIVDEEHDSSYKQQEEMPCYHARDVAVMRGWQENCVVLLGSATPSIESRYNGEKGKYKLHLLPRRASSTSLPTVRVIDLEKARAQAGGFTHFSAPLLKGIEERLTKGEQTLLLLNKRGYYRMQVCSSCRTITRCPHCDLSLTFHKNEEKLSCHLCGFTRPPPSHCPTCEAKEPLAFKGFGTEHVERSLHALFPTIRTLRMDRDTTRNKFSHEELFRNFRAHKADVLIGTQMIAKGLHFPGVTLVGVLQIDSSLTIPDFRAPEQIFQLLTQVAGRAGREDTPGEVLFQTAFPDHPILQLAAAQDYDAFYQTTLQERSLFSYPPFSHLVKVSYKASSAQEVEQKTLEGHAFLSKHLPPGATLFPPTPAGHPKIKNLYYFQFLLKTDRIGKVSSLLQALSRETGAKIDIDPLSTFF